MAKFNRIMLGVHTILLITACEKNAVDLPASAISISGLKDHTFYLASDELRGRKTGSREYYMAAAYAAVQFHAHGLIPVCTDSTAGQTFFQYIPGTGNDSVYRAISIWLETEGPDAYPGMGKSFAELPDGHDPLSQMNIVALVKGTDDNYAGEYITAGAHLDHIGIRNDSVCNGADDNASGCAVILEVAEAVARSHPKRSVLFILYDNEEGGMAGSRFFVRNSPVPTEQIKVNINLDMVGRPDGLSTELGVLGADRIDSGLKELIYTANEKKSMLPLDSIDYRNYFRRSDQYSYYNEGIPSVLLTTGEHNEYHTPRDDADKIDYAFLEKVSFLAYEVIMTLANE